MVDGISWDQLLEQAGDTISDSYEPLPVDTYDLEVVEATHTITKAQPPRDMWKIQAKVTGEGKYKNRRIFSNVLLDPNSENGLKFFFTKMGAMGLNREYFQTKPTNDAISGALKGRAFRGKVVQRPYLGEIQNDIDRFLPAASGASTPAPGAPPAPQAAAPAPPAPAAAPPAPAPAPAVPQETHAAPPAPAPNPVGEGAPAPTAAPPAPAPAPQPQAGEVPPPPPLGNLPF